MQTKFAIVTSMGSTTARQKTHYGRNFSRRRRGGQKSQLSPWSHWRKTYSHRKPASVRVVYNYNRYYDPATGRYIRPDPLGALGMQLHLLKVLNPELPFGQDINPYVYASSNPFSWIDPPGLWSISLEAYEGVGGGINITYFNGTLEFTGRIGVGLGIGLSFDPKSTPSPHSKPCGSGYIARTVLRAGAGLGVGVVDVGTSLAVASGNAVTTPVGGGYVDFSPLDVSKGIGEASFGFKASANWSAELGSYSNWGDAAECRCQ